MIMAQIGAALGVAGQELAALALMDEDATSRLTRALARGAVANAERDPFGVLDAIAAAVEESGTVIPFGVEGDDRAPADVTTNYAIRVGIVALAIAELDKLRTAAPDLWPAGWAARLEEEGAPR